MFGYVYINFMSRNGENGEKMEVSSELMLT